MINLENINMWSIVVQLIAAIGTIGSVLWAIHVYHKENDNRNLLDIKDNILKIPAICSDINILLSEPFFAALGNSIADELKKLHEKGQSFESFSNFLLSDEKSHNYKAQAIYSGLKRCDEVNQIKEMLKMLQDAERSIILRFPGLGQAIRKLSFYINRAATRTVSSHILNKSIAATLDDGVENESFRSAVSNAAATGSTELYFKELAIYITSVIKSSLKQGVLGQRTIDLSLIMIENTCSAFGEIEINKLKKFCKKDSHLMKKKNEDMQKHAVEDAMIILKNYKRYYKEEQWDKMIECKGRIIENMESNDD